MNEKPLERLHFFNGQRLQAEDFRLEQDYHMRVRRWLNRSLYTAGIASGLEVRVVPEFPKVRVSPGLALDCFGREIILIDEQEIPVQGYGIHYLTIRYQEDTTASRDACCPPSSGSKNHTASGGPSRVLAEPVLEWSTSLPNEESGKILLARVELAAGCKKVKTLDTGVRRYVGAASAAKVRQYALEGEREVACLPTYDNSGRKSGETDITARVYFHIRGRQPNAVTLYLKAEEISALHYTELPAHTHSVTIEGGTDDPDRSLEHQHESGGFMAADEWSDSAGATQTSDHEGHTLKARMGYVGQGRIGWTIIPPDVHPNPEPNTYSANQHAAFFLIERDWGVHVGAQFDSGIAGIDAIANLFNNIVIAPETNSNTDNDILLHTQGKIAGGKHEHAVRGTSGNSTGSDASGLVHRHAVNGSGISGETGTFDSGQPGKFARVGKAPLTFVSNLQVAIDDVDVTNSIKEQMVGSAPINDRPLWRLGLGDGTGSHPIASRVADAIAIRLDFLPGVVLGEGQHVIEFSVGLAPGDNANGGRIHYNLYIE